MTTLKRAERVRLDMEKGTGRLYNILWDTKWNCFRVIPKNEWRPNLVELTNGLQLSFGF